MRKNSILLLVPVFFTYLSATEVAPLDDRVSPRALIERRIQEEAETYFRTGTPLPASVREGLKDESVSSELRVALGLRAVDQVRAEAARVRAEGFALSPEMIDQAKWARGIVGGAHPELWAEISDLIRAENERALQREADAHFSTNAPLPASVRDGLARAEVTEEFRVALGLRAVDQVRAEAARVRAEGFALSPEMIDQAKWARGIVGGAHPELWAEITRIIEAHEG